MNLRPGTPSSISGVCFGNIHNVNIAVINNVEPNTTNGKK